MQITLSPLRCDERLDASVSGDVLTVNGVALDFGPLQEGEVLPVSACDSRWLAGEVRRIDGEIHLTLMLPHGANAPLETRFPAAYHIPMTVLSGTVPLPPYDAEPKEPTDD